MEIRKSFVSRGLRYAEVCKIEVPLYRVEHIGIKIQLVGRNQLASYLQA